MGFRFSVLTDRLTSDTLACPCYVEKKVKIRKLSACSEEIMAPGWIIWHYLLRNMAWPQESRERWWGTRLAHSRLLPLFSRWRLPFSTAAQSSVPGQCCWYWLSCSTSSVNGFHLKFKRTFFKRWTFKKNCLDIRNALCYSGKGCISDHHSFLEAVTTKLEMGVVASVFKLVILLSTFTNLSSAETQYVCA